MGFPTNLCVQWWILDIKQFFVDRKNVGKSTQMNTKFRLFNKMTISIQIELIHINNNSNKYRNGISIDRTKHSHARIYCTFLKVFCLYLIYSGISVFFSSFLVLSCGIRLCSFIHRTNHFILTLFFLFFLHSLSVHLLCQSVCTNFTEIFLYWCCELNWVSALNIL